MRFWSIIFFEDFDINNMIDQDYKDESQPSNLRSILLKDDRDMLSQNQSIPTDLTSLNVISACNDLISSALESYYENEFECFFEIIKKMIFFLDKLYYDGKYDIYSILPEIYNPHFNYCLIESINPSDYSPQNINDVLALISTISSFSENFQFFRKSSIFDIVYHLLELQEPAIYLECILLINQYMVIFQTTQFPYDSNTFLQTLGEISNYSNITKYIAESLKCFIIYVDVSQFLDDILLIFNNILQKIQSRHGFNDIIDSLLYIINADSSNYSHIFQCKIIHIFSDLLKNNLLQEFEKYKNVIQNFFEFLRTSFEKINWEWQRKTLKVIGIDTFSLVFEIIHDEKIILEVYLIMFKYLQSHCNIDDDEIPFFSNMLNHGFISYLLKTFQDQSFELKKEILIVINKLLKTQNQELFSQLLVYDQNANYIDICCEFAFSIDDDVKVQRVFLESLISLVQIGEINQQKNLITESPIVKQYITNCLNNEDQHIQELTQYYLSITVTQ